jgi:hypothetical protein
MFSLRRYRIVDLPETTAAQLWDATESCGSAGLVECGDGGSAGIAGSEEILRMAIDERLRSE